MSVDTIKKIKQILLVILAISLFVSTQTLTNRYGDKATIIEAFLMTLIITIILVIGTSDWMHDYLIERGVKIQYKTYQKIGIFITSLFIFVIFGAVYNEIYNAHMGIISLIVFAIFASIFVSFL